MAFRISRKRDVNVGRVIGKIVGTVILLYVGGSLWSSLGSALRGTCAGPMLDGATGLIGYTTAATLTNGTTGWYRVCSNWTAASGTTAAVQNDTYANAFCAQCVTHVNNGSGILSIIAIIAIAWVVLEFVNVSF